MGKSECRDLPFSYRFLMIRLMKCIVQNNVLEIVNIFSASAIFIACLGLFGCYFHCRATHKRDWQICAWASVPGITMLLSKDF